jgi:quercetin dioxygenase-like cupin family protein
MEDAMSNIQPRLRPALITTLFIALSVQLSVQTSLAQAPTNIVRTVLAVTSLPSVVDAPLFFKLSRVELHPGQMTTYSGPVGFVYVLSGTLSVQTNAAQQSLRQDDAMLVAANNAYSLKSSATEPALFLHFVFGRSTELDQAAEHSPAVITEIYRSPQAVPDLKPGRYEFTLTRVSYPRMTPNVPHYRSGAALYYIRSGLGIFIADGKTETKQPGTAHFERHGWLHQWANDADEPLVLLQANISEEGAPAVVMTQPAGSVQK